MSVSQQIKDAFEVADRSLPEIPVNSISSFAFAARYKGLPVHGTEAANSLARKISLMVTEENHLEVLKGLVDETRKTELREGLLERSLIVVLKRNFGSGLEERVVLCTEAISSMSLTSCMKTIVAFLRGGGEIYVTPQDVETYKRAKEKHPTLPAFVTDGVVIREAQTSYLTPTVLSFRDGMRMFNPFKSNLERHAMLVRLDSYFRTIRFGRSRKEIEEGLKGTNLESQSAPLNIITGYHRTVDQFITDAELQQFKTTTDYKVHQEYFDQMEKRSW